jgi:hypothetical protein
MLGSGFDQSSIRAPQDKIHFVRPLLKIDQLRAEPLLGASLTHCVRAKIIPQLLLEDWLAKRVPPRISILLRGWAYAQKTRPACAEIIGPITEYNSRKNGVDNSNRLHGAQRFIVN